MTKKKISLTTYIIVFLVIFNPPVYKGISFTQIAIVVSAVLCVFNMKKIFKVANDYEFKKAIILYIFFALWCIVSGVVNGLFSKNIRIIMGNIFSTCFYLCCAIIVSLGLAIFFQMKNYSLDQVMDIFIFVGVAQACISLACLLVPAVKVFLNEWTIHNSNSPALVRAFAMNNYRRNYGFASTLFDIFGCTMSILAIMAFSKAVNGKPKYLVGYGMICVSAVLNARTSIILISIGSVIMFFCMHGMYIKRNVLLIRMIVVTAGVIVLTIIVKVLNGNSSATIDWLRDGLDQIMAMMQGKKTGYFSMLFNQMIFFPPLLESFTGTGLRPNQATIRGSDVGYVQNIWQFGIIGSILLYAAYIQLFKKARKCIRVKYPGMIMALFSMVMLYMIKLNCLGYSMASTVFLTFLVYCVVDQNCKKDISNERNISAEQ